jgi:hypothetical protein
VKIIKETAAAAKQKPSDAVAIVSYDEKPGIQAIAMTAPDLSPEPEPGSWLHLVEGFFSKLAGSVLRHIRVCNGPLQSGPRRPHVVLQTRSRRLI